MHFEFKIDNVKNVLNEDVFVAWHKGKYKMYF